MRSVFGRAVVVAGAVVVGLGSAAGAAAAKPRPPVLAFSPAPYNYGQVAAGQAASQTFTLANTGGQATGRLRVTLTGAAAFTLAGETCHRLRPGKRCTVTVRFAPAGSGTVTATLSAAGKRAAATDVLTGGGRWARRPLATFTGPLATRSGKPTSTAAARRPSSQGHTLPVEWR